MNVEERVRELKRHNPGLEVVRGKKMGKIEIDTLDKLGTHLTEQNETLEGMKARIDELESKQTDTDRAFTGLQATNRALKAGYRSDTENSAGVTKGGNFLKALLARDFAKAKEYGGKPASPDWAKAMTGSNSLYSDATTGSYLVPIEFHDEIIRALGEKSVMLPLIREIRMGSRTKTVPVKATGAALTWITAGQGTALTESSLTFDQKTLTAYPLAAWLSFTESMLDDDAAGLGDFAKESFSDDLADELDNQILNGTGSPWTGILQDTNTNTVTMSAGSVSFSDIEHDNIVDLIGGLAYTKYRRGASFIANPTVLDTLRKIKDANGTPIYRDPDMGNPSRLVGYPIHSCDAMPSASATNTPFICFGNYKFFLLGKRKELIVELFDKTVQAVTEEEVFIRAYSRWAGVVAIPAAFSVLKTAAA